MLLTFVAMMTILVQGTRAVPLHAAVKATYLMPVSVVFAFWAALGVDWLGTFHRRWLKPTLVACTVLALASSVVFLQGRVVAREWFERWRDASLWQNAYGVVYYAAGDSVHATELFERAAAKDFHLGYENLATVALDDDRPLEALHYLRNAARLQPAQSLGTPWDRALFNKLTRAEYLNTMAVIYDRLGWPRAAMAAALEAVASDRTMPEASYDLAILKLERATSRPGPANAPWRVAFLAQSRTLLFNAIVNDPGFREARELAGTIEALSGNCDAAIQMIEDALRPAPNEYRRYPVITGVGDLLASSARRRRYITKLPEALRPQFQLKRCSEDRRDHEA
jgi:tetratricopeptide (TPR) repeat protein